MTMGEPHDTGETMMATPLVRSEIARLIDRYRKAAEGRLRPEPESDGTLAEADWQRLKAAFPAAPEQLHEFLAAHNGDGAGRLLPPFTLHNAAHIAAHGPGMVHYWQRVERSCGLVGWSSAAPDRACLTERSWRAALLPIGESNGETLFVDGEPGPTGHQGQVVFAEEDGRTLLVLAPSLGDLLRRAAELAKDSADAELMLYPHVLAKR